MRRYHSSCSAPLAAGYLLWISAGAWIHAEQPQPKEIPLASIVTTSDQKKLVRAYDNKSGRKLIAALERLLDPSKIAGPTNTFLIEAPTFEDAITTTIKIANRGYSAEVPAELDEAEPNSVRHWLVVYLGVAGSDPVRWGVERVQINKGRIRFSYRVSTVRYSTTDVRQYWFWVPLGKLQDDVYKLELYDLALEEVTLMRRVEVTPPRNVKTVPRPNR